MTQIPVEKLRAVFLAGIAANVLYFLYLLGSSSVVNSGKGATSPTVGTPKRSSGFQPLNLTYENFDQFTLPVDEDNATAIFNEVNNALKQKNSNLNPISVSYFPVYVPIGTHVFHSTRGDNQIPASYEWIAMDWEFSYSFAHMNRGKPGGRWGPGGPGGGPPGGRPGGPGGAGPGGGFGGGIHHGAGGGGAGPVPPPHNEGAPVMLTFEVVKPLDRMLYLGGSSAAKDDAGDMDTQYVLSQADSYDTFNERWGAEKICAWGKQFGGIDGYIRIENAFEAVLCDFHEKVKLIGNQTLSNVTGVVELPYERFDNESMKDPVNIAKTELFDDIQQMASYDWAWAGARVGQGEDRVFIDWAKFVTPINRTYISTDPFTRRIFNISEKIKKDLVTEVGDGLKTPNDPFTTTDWRQQTSMIEEKFGPLLGMLNTSYAIYDIEQDPHMLGDNITLYTYNFIRRYMDAELFEFTDERQRFATWEYVHPSHPIKSASEQLIYSSLIKVQQRILTVMKNQFNLGKTLLARYRYEELPEDTADLIEAGETELRTLLDDLKWVIYYRCQNACKLDEICLYPGWGPGPTGGGHVHPSYDCQCISWHHKSKH